MSCRCRQNIYWFEVERSRESSISGPILQAKEEIFSRLLNKGPEYTRAESWIKLIYSSSKITLHPITLE